MTTPDDHRPKRTEPPPAGSGIPRSQDQAMVMTQMLMRWMRRSRPKHKTEVNTHAIEPVGPSSPIGRDDEVGYEVRVEDERRMQARAEQSVQRFVGLREADAQVLADESDLAVRFFRHGESLTEDYCAGRITAQVEDGVVVDARATN